VNELPILFFIKKLYNIVYKIMAFAVKAGLDLVPEFEDFVRIG
jgi:hypothetical protein